MTTAQRNKLTRLEPWIRRLPIYFIYFPTTSIGTLIVLGGMHWF